MPNMMLDITDHIRGRVIDSELRKYRDIVGGLGSTRKQQADRYYSMYKKDVDSKVQDIINAARDRIGKVPCRQGKKG